MSTDGIDPPSPAVLATRVYEQVSTMIRATGLHFASVEPIVEDGLVTEIDVRFRGDTDFETLSKIAKAFGTTRIELKVEIGPETDPFVSPYLLIHDPIVPALADA